MLSLLLLLPLVVAQTVVVPPFTPIAPPGATSPIYGANCNDTLYKSQIVQGKAFDRIIQIWMENMDFATAASDPVFQKLATQGILFNASYAFTHPSEPNYASSVGGSTWGISDDLFHAIPSNRSTIADLLDQKHISWAEYEENMPYNGYPFYNYTQANYVNASAPPYTYYVRKNNPLALYDSVLNVSYRANRIRTFNCFSRDLAAAVIPQWTFVTPNLLNNAHDTNITYGGWWLEYWLMPLLNNPAFNDGRTIIYLTFDENLTTTINNRVWSMLLGGVIPKSMWGTIDNTFYTHYSILSTVEANWGLGSLGLGDTNKTLANVWEFVAEKTGYENTYVAPSMVPPFNVRGGIPGPLNPNASMQTPWPIPNNTAVSAGGAPVYGSCASLWYNQGRDGLPWAEGGCSCSSWW